MSGISARKHEPTMTEFDRLVARQGTFSAKWDKYKGRDVLPFWVADMDFAAPRFLLDSLRDRLDHPVLGYTRIPDDLVTAFLTWLQRNYQWKVPKEWLVWIPSVVSGLNLAAMGAARPSGSILIPTPVYYPFLSVPAHAGQRCLEAPMQRNGMLWEMDFDAMSATLGADTHMVMIANPQNPTGRVYSEQELRTLAAFAERRDLIICSDEIHCGLLLDPTVRHLPIASLGTDIAARTISLYSVTKSYNIPGLSCAVAVIPNPSLRQRFQNARRGLTPSIGPLAFVASAAAFADRSDWLHRLLDYLRGNHEVMLSTLGARMTPVEGTYLAWIDLRDLDLTDPVAYFEGHGLGLSDGADFGRRGFVRFNFGCPRGLLQEGLARLTKGLDQAAGSVRGK